MTITTSKQASAAIPASAPTSPLLMRAAKKAGANSGLPVTPQRLPRAAVARHPQSQQHQRTLSSLRSPLTPASDASSPHTPGLSNLSFTSSINSTLATPSHGGTEPAGLDLELGASPELTESKKKLPSSADEADNWRCRASQNGIKVSSSTESQYGDDEDSECVFNSPTRPSSRTITDMAPLPAPFLSTHRRARSSTQAQNQGVKTVSRPPSTPDRRSLATIATLNTPPPRANIIDKLKLKGVSTEPPQPRRRVPYGPVPTELFDIDENDYNPYPHSFTGVQPINIPASFNDPFNVSLTSIAESASPFIDDNPLELPNVERPAPTCCSVCDIQATRVAVLEPCGHPLCSACLTSALNIVGEKDMQCAVCSQGVADFKLQTVATVADSSPEATIPATSTPPTGRKKSASLLPSVFDHGESEANPFVFFEQPQNASTPPSAAHKALPGENIVLRIDNVPWDITPPAIANWLKQPVERVHVLLDRKGKTLSHAFVEVANDDIAKAALRGAQNSVLGRGKRARGVTVTRSTQDEVMRALFPSWQGSFDGTRPSLTGLSNEQVICALEGGLITESELNSLLHLIRSPDSHFLKVPSLPFHSLVSILAKFPTDPSSRVFWSTALRDNLFDVASAAIQVMLPRVTENQTPENLDLLSQLLNAATSCQAFTPQQAAHLAELAQHAPAQLQQNGVAAAPVAHFARYPQPQMQASHLPPRAMPQPHTMPLGPLPGLNMNMGMRMPSAPLPQAYRAPPPIHQLPMQMPHTQPYATMPMHHVYREYAQAPVPQQLDFRGQMAGHGVAPSPLDALAREFGVDAGLIEALAQRLSGMR